MINKSYLKATDTIKASFKHNGSIELKLFMESNKYVDFRKKICSLKTDNIFEPLTCKHSIKKSIKVDEEITNFVEKITGSKILSWQLWSFNAGNYTVINDEALEKPGIDIIMDLTSNWESEFGGSIVYVDGSGESTKISAEDNKLIIIKRNKGEHRFIQYVNHLAKKNKRIFLIARI